MSALPAARCARCCALSSSSVGSPSSKFSISICVSHPLVETSKECERIVKGAFATWAARLVRAFALDKGVAEDEAERWFEQLVEADKEGRFGFVSVPVLTTAIAT